MSNYSFRGKMDAVEFLVGFKSIIKEQLILKNDFIYELDEVIHLEAEFLKHLFESPRKGSFNYSYEGDRLAELSETVNILMTTFDVDKIIEELKDTFLEQLEFFKNKYPVEDN